jgi:hypothetical protein
MSSDAKGVEKGHDFKSGLLLHFLEELKGVDEGSLLPVKEPKTGLSILVYSQKGYNVQLAVDVQG